MHPTGDEVVGHVRRLLPDTRPPEEEGCGSGTEMKERGGRPPRKAGGAGGRWRKAQKHVRWRRAGRQCDRLVGRVVGRKLGVFPSDGVCFFL